MISVCVIAIISIKRSAGDYCYFGEENEIDARCMSHGCLGQVKVIARIASAKALDTFQSNGFHRLGLECAGGSVLLLLATDVVVAQ